jgi:translocation and assembly module TamA
MDIIATRGRIAAAPLRLRRGAFDRGFRRTASAAFWLHRNLFGGAERLRIDGEIRGIGAGVSITFDGVDGVDVGS